MKDNPGYHATSYLYRPELSYRVTLADFDNFVQEESDVCVVPTGKLDLDHDLFDSWKKMDISVVPSVIDLTPLETTLCKSLAIVGLQVDGVKLEPSFSPHGREMAVLADIPTFLYNGEVVEEWLFPPMGAERLSLKALNSLGVGVTGAIISTKAVERVVDAAREKIDGKEMITFGICGRFGTVYIEWGPNSIRVCDDIEPSLCEVVDNDGIQEVYLLQGSKMGAKEHEWERLTTNLVDRVAEGLILRIDGREYRVPRRHSATFETRSRETFYSTGERVIVEDAYDISGFKDYEYDCGKWYFVKMRPDKVRADSYRGVQTMLLSSATMMDMEEKMVIPHLPQEKITWNRVVLVYKNTTIKADKDYRSYVNDRHVMLVNKRKYAEYLYYDSKGNALLKPNELLISGNRSSIKRSTFKPFIINECLYYSPKPVNEFSRLFFLRIDKFCTSYVLIRGRSYLRAYVTKISKMKVMSGYESDGQSIKIQEIERHDKS